MNPEIEQAVADLESLLGTPLPADYRKFLLAFGGDELAGKNYWMPHPNGRWIEIVEQCYCVDDLLDIMPHEIEIRRDGLSHMAPGFMPIADNGCGDAVLLSYRDRDFGAVYHDFHEEEPGLYLLAPTFTEWLRQIETFSEHAPETPR